MVIVRHVVTSAESIWVHMGLPVREKVNAVQCVAQKWEVEYRCIRCILFFLVIGARAVIDIRIN